MSTDLNKTVTDQEDQASPAKDSQDKILKNLARRLSDDYFNQKNFPSRNMPHGGDAEIQELNHFIKRSAGKIAGKEDEDNQEDSELNVSFAPTSFDGVSGPDEERTLLKEQLKHLERENLKLKHQLELLKTDYETEKKHLSTTIRDLKSELHRTAPLTDNKFFTFSKDLREVVNAVKSLSDEELEESPSAVASHLDLDLGLPIPPSVTLESPLDRSSTSMQPRQIQKAPESIPESPVVKETKPEEAKEPKEDQKTLKKSSKKAKTIITMATVAAIIGFGLSAFFISRKPAVNQDLVNAYLEKPGEVQGTTTTQDKAEPEASPTPTLVRKEFKNNEVPYEETQWETFRDEFLGFQVQYPGNVTDLLHTGHTITFLRKDGYLFKMQRIQTQETVDEYWERTKTDGLTYNTEPTTLASQKGLHLILEEQTEFPGNRYLIKVNDHVFDLWYATSAEKFSPEDKERVEFMIKSIRFL